MADFVSAAHSRAHATRWLGDAARRDDARPNFMHRLKDMDPFLYPKLERGGVLEDPSSPRSGPTLSPRAGTLKE